MVKASTSGSGVGEAKQELVTNVISMKQIDLLKAVEGKYCMFVTSDL